MKFASFLTLLMILSASIAVAVSAADDGSEGCLVLIDFGNGKVLWTSVEVRENLSAFNVTMDAAGQLGLDVSYSESSFGVFVNGIGGVMGDWPNEWWHFWIWNPASKAWESATQGPSSVAAKDIVAIAWSYVVDRPDFSAQSPLATPDHKYPWTSLRHDLLSTGSSQTGSSAKISLDWDKDLTNGPVSTSVVAANDRLYVLTSGVYDWTQMTYDSPPHLSCLNRAGEILWNATIDGAKYQIASPMITEDFVVVPSSNGKVYAFDSKTGAPYWISGIESSGTGLTSSPILYRNQVIVGGGDGKLYSFADNGTLLWATKVASSIYFSSPAARDGMVYIGSEEGQLHAVAANGTGEIWNVTVGGKVRSAPLLLENEIVVTYSTYEDITAVDGGAVAVSYDGEELWRVDVNATSSSAAETISGVVVSSADGLTMISLGGQVIWRTSLGAHITGSPSVGKDAIYAVTSEEQSRVVAVNLSGAIIWSYALEPKQYSMCSPTISDDVLYVTSDNGHVYAFSLIEPEQVGGGNMLLLIIVFIGIFTILMIGAIGNWIGRKREG
jgi:outer membrane protein assembly factor BamB